MKNKNPQSILSLAEIFILNPEIKKGIHLHAAIRHNEWLIKIYGELAKLSVGKTDLNADINTYLNDTDKDRVEKCKEVILEWLWKCTNIGTGYSPYSPVYADWVISPMIELKSLIIKAYQAKTKKLETERKQREREQKWDAAYKALNTPVDDAKKYLSNEEYEEYLKSINGAVLAYMEKRGAYKNDSRSVDYRQWLWVINHRKEKERQQIEANLAAREYNQRLNDERARLKALLFSNEKNTAAYFKNHAKDARYTGESFSQFLDSEEIGAFDKKIEDTGRSRFAKLVNNDFHESFYAKYYRSFFLLPSAEYSLEGIVPCLDFIFEVFAVVETRVWFKPESKNFGLKEPEFLGYDYFLLNPEDLGGYSFWQVIPLVLLKGLLNGETKPNSTIISAASDDNTTYKILKFKEEVDIPDKFADYLKNIGNFDRMLNMGIMSEKVGSVVRSLDGQKPESSEELKTLESRKAQAYQLFNEGKRPSDSEVKTLGIKPNSAYRYYQAWKRTHNGSNKLT